MEQHLHIVCLDVPYPPDYGGAMDMFYRLQALHECGIKIHLHYFSYNHRGNPNELNRYCESIHVYKRKTGLKGFSFRLPYIVSSRINEELIAGLTKDNYPVLLEGAHCTGILEDIRQPGRKITVRMHNDECEYYRQLAGAETNLLKKLYFLNESRLLKKYEHSLPKTETGYACITEKDTLSFQKQYGLTGAVHIPAFGPFTEITAQPGMGGFCLYHGNLSVPENEKMALWLLNKVFTKTKIPFVVAGKSPSEKLKKVAHLCQHTCLVADPSETEMNDLVQKAHINILPSCTTSGQKLKLLFALSRGRHCIVNDNMIRDSNLDEACHVANSADAIASIAAQLYHQPFTEEEITLRKKLLSFTDNKTKAKQLIQLLHLHCQ